MFALFEDACSFISIAAGSLRSPAVMHIGPLRGPAIYIFTRHTNINHSQALVYRQ